jgi:DNA replication protein DnaC
VQLLQTAKVNLQLQAALLNPDKYDLLVCDDISHVKKLEAETYGLFKLIAHRYQLKSLRITANSPFLKSEADKFTRASKVKVSGRHVILCFVSA